MTKSKAVGGRVPFEVGTLVWRRTSYTGPYIILSDDGDKVRLGEYYNSMGTLVDGVTRPAVLFTDLRPPSPLARCLSCFWNLVRPWR